MSANLEYKSIEFVDILIIQLQLILFREIGM